MIQVRLRYGSLSDYLTTQLPVKLPSEMEKKVTFYLP